MDVYSTHLWAAIIGLLVGVLLSVVVYGLLRERHQRRARRAYKRQLRAAARAQKSAAQARKFGSGINEYLRDDRQRPSFNPNPGPRDW